MSYLPPAPIIVATIDLLTYLFYKLLSVRRNRPRKFMPFPKTKKIAEPLAPEGSSDN